MARMIARAAFVVGVDTGLLHLAAALGVPLVAIFVGSEPGLHGPLGAGKIEIVGALGRDAVGRRCAGRRRTDRALSRAGLRASARCVTARTCSAAMSRMQR